MVAARGLAPRFAVVLLALVALAGCDRAQQVSQGVDKARDCAALIGEIANLDLDPQSVARAAGQAQSTAQRLNDAARNVDEADVRNAAEDLAAKVEALASKAESTSPAEVEQRVREVTQAATRLASTCNVPVDQVIRSG